MTLGVFNFLEENSRLSHSVVFLYFFALITEEGFLISLCYALEVFIHMLVSFLFSFAFCFSSFHSYLWSTGEGNGKPLQYSCLENPMNSMKRKNDSILKEELPRSVSAQHDTGYQWRNNSRKNEGMEPKQKTIPSCGGDW